MSRKTRGQEVWCSPITPGAAPAWLGRGRMPSLDGLRALAILMVIYAHGRFPFDDLLPLRALKGRCGFLGVQVFFVLSGFLITTLMVREVRNTGRLSLRQFYLRRALRIVPAYAAFLAALAVLEWCGQMHLGGLRWLALGTYTVNFLPSVPGPMSQVWSLSVEEHFYLVWPLLLATGTLARGRKVALGCMAGSLGLRWLLLLGFPGRNYPIDQWTFTRIDDIAVGCLLAFLAWDPGWRRRLDGLLSGKRRLGLLLVVVLGSQLCFSRLIGSRLFGPVPLMLVVGIANDVNTLAIAVLLWAVLTRPDGTWGKLLNHRVAIALGTVSYSLYLWHPLFCGGERVLLCSFPQNLLFMFLTAAASYVLVERPFLSLKDRLTSATPRPGPVP